MSLSPPTDGSGSRLSLAHSWAAAVTAAWISCAIRRAVILRLPSVVVDIPMTSTFGEE